MSSSSRIPLRPLASASRGRHGPFGALLASASADPVVARGLAMAYASLDTCARQRIVEVAVADAQAEGLAVSSVLVSLLAVEEDPGVAQQIADAIARVGGVGLERMAAPRALVAGDQDRGGVVLIRPLHGTFVEVLALAWEREQGITHALFDPLVHDGDAAGQTAQLPQSLRFEEMPVDFAIDLVAPALWSHRRLHGTLPPGVRRFADLFSIEPAPDGDSLAQAARLLRGVERLSQWSSAADGFDPFDGAGGGIVGE